MILAIETSGAMAGVALVDGDLVVREDAFPSQMALCQRLVPRIEALVRAEAVDDQPGPRDLRAIAVSLGPGSFTSLRIGVATAKALAHAWEVDLVGVPTAHAIANGLGDVPEGALVCALTVARRDHVYVALVEGSPDGGWRDVQPYEVHSVEALPDVLSAREETLVLCGEAAEEHFEPLQERMGEGVRMAADGELRPTAEHVGFVGSAELERRGPDDLFSLTPIYAQTSQAEAARGIDLGL